MLKVQKDEYIKKTNSFSIEQMCTEIHMFEKQVRFLDDKLWGDGSDELTHKEADKLADEWYLKKQYLNLARNILEKKRKAFKGMHPLLLEKGFGLETYPQSDDDLFRRSVRSGQGYIIKGICL